MLSSFSHSLSIQLISFCQALTNKRIENSLKAPVSSFEVVLLWDLCKLYLRTLVLFSWRLFGKKHEPTSLQGFLYSPRDSFSSFLAPRWRSKHGHTKWILQDKACSFSGSRCHRFTLVVDGVSSPSGGGAFSFSLRFPVGSTSAGNLCQTMSSNKVFSRRFWSYMEV